MARCKLCKKDISDGTEYCTDCIDKKDIISNESYLDSLLDSVQGGTATARDIYKIKKEKSSGESSDFGALNDSIVNNADEISGDINKIDNVNNSETEHNIDDEFLESAEAIEQDSDLNENLDSDIADILKELDLEHDLDLAYMDSEDVDSDDDYADYLESLDIDTNDLNADGDYMVDNIDDDDLFNNEIFAMLGQDDSEDNDNEAQDHGLLADEPHSEAELSPESELLNLLNHFNPENPGDDIQTISDLLGGISEINKSEDDYPEDVGEVFHEALEAVSDLSDSDNGILDISQEIDFQDKKKKRKKKKEKKKEKKDNLFVRVFGNVEYSEAELKKIKAKEEAVALKKSKKGNDKNEATQDEEEKEDPSDIKRQRAEERALAKAERKKAKLAKKESKKKEIIEIIDEVDEGRINRVGAGVVFVFFGALVILMLVSTNLFSYSLSIKNATNYFNRQKYTQAYNEVYGIELKDEDIELYDKIMTVMFVNKQLNSYNNYYHMRKYPEALDSLLKGLQRYDKYVELATLLGIKTDLDYVRNQIIAELYNVFSLTEEDAMNILNSESQAKYSIAVYDVVLENISFY